MAFGDGQWVAVGFESVRIAECGEKISLLVSPFSRRMRIGDWNTIRFRTALPPIQPPHENIHRTPAGELDIYRVPAKGGSTVNLTAELDKNTQEFILGWR